MVAAEIIQFATSLTSRVPRKMPLIPPFSVHSAQPTLDFDRFGVYIDGFGLEEIKTGFGCHG